MGKGCPTSTLGRFLGTTPTGLGLPQGFLTGPPDPRNHTSAEGCRVETPYRLVLRLCYSGGFGSYAIPHLTFTFQWVQGIIAIGGRMLGFAI